jgi:hypothetical protein
MGLKTRATCNLGESYLVHSSHTILFALTVFVVFSARLITQLMRLMLRDLGEKSSVKTSLPGVASFSTTVMVGPVCVCAKLS